MGIGIMKTAKNISAMVLLVNIMVILLAKPSPICAAYPVLTLYSGDGRSLTISGQNSPDLGDMDFDDVATTCQAHGWWIVYADYNYHGAFQLVKDTYKELEYALKGKVSSVRSVGSSDNSLDSTLTLYQGINLQGREVYYYDDNSNLDGSASSLILTGSEPWTLYSASNFGGNSGCINPDVVYNTNGLTIRSIRSVRRGCF